MTIGIYLLNFKNTKKVYVGQSINIEDRIVQHIRSFNSGTCSSKMREAHKIFGYKDYTILLECGVLELNTSEVEAISIYNSVAEGFNTVTDNDMPSLYGQDNGNSKYTESDYYNVLCLLGQPGYSVKQIEAITNVSRYVISHISSLESHCWMKDRFPEEYKKLEDIKYGRGRKSAFMQGIRYPTIYSPEGVPYNIEHMTNFSKEHGLSQPKVSEVLKGTRNHHKGWRIKQV